ncbi:DUF4357 domain-containing protein [Pollutimonas harenae]|uniref:DUF4357 domain-containing protein n=1 Tax=Pollutimonas harenae TaxID=657015 RepID=A0A853GW90_9BURK|nr:DUF4357 domain-containing protein [Pollutimonas harenae]NYT85016.1 DUF4357 domain-containing protein [Pollutimonas harenae]TEA72598.1 DUF4357 domain-containing protein [Pollutimonas harenae]
MAHTLTAKEQALAKIFSDDYVFTIPGYQRPYSWGKDQAEELLDDLLSALSAAPEHLSDAAPYFLGSIVLIKTESKSDAIVVDGQQRLTTLTLLLSAIRAAISDASIQADITSCIYERGSLVKGTQARYRLVLRDRDRDFFRQYVQHEDGLSTLIKLNTPLPDAQARLRTNAQIFLDSLAKLTELELGRLVQFIITRCYLVTVATPDLDSAYRIFGVLNSRGLDLNATDILKAEIIGGIAAKQRDAYTKKWEDAEDDLGREDFGDLFSHIRMVYRKAKPQGTLLKEFKAHVNPVSQPADFIDNILIPMAKAFGELQAGAYASQKYAEQVNEHLHWLNRLEFKDWVPPALAFFVQYRDQPELVLSFFRDLERLGYSMLIRKIGVNGRIERFSSLTGIIEAGKDLWGETSLLQLSPVEQHETFKALNGPLYDTHSSRALAILLLRLDRLMSDASAIYQHDVVSVEHVMPQQPASDSEWQTWISEPTTRQQWLHRLGNLALLSRKKNSAASNRDFCWKKTAYFTKGGVSSFALTTQVLQHQKWTSEVMEKRQFDMLQTLESHWRLHDRKSKEDSADEGALFELESAKHGLSARAQQCGQTFVVQADSLAKLDWRGEPHSYQQLRENLCSRGMLVPSDGGMHLLFTCDVAFTSPSAASATVLGRTDNGRNTWRLKGTSITYAEWQDNLTTGAAAVTDDID